MLPVERSGLSAQCRKLELESRLRIVSGARACPELALIHVDSKFVILVYMFRADWIEAQRVVRARLCNAAGNLVTQITGNLQRAASAVNREHRQSKVAG